MTPTAGPRLRIRLSLGLAALAMIAATAVVPAAAAAESAGPLAPVSLRCEYLVNPMGIDMPKPRFFWVNGHKERGQVQSAYQIVVSTDPEAGAGDIWDSGRIASPRSTQIAFAGKALESGKSYFWKVRAWDRDGRESPWSAAARFDTGLFEKSDWKGVWIGTKNQLRKEFAVKGRVKRARAYIAGLGYYELRINGRKAGSHVLDPAWTTYDKRVLYATYDVTPLVREGANAVAVTLGNGWYKSRALLLQLNVELEDGSVMNVVSDASWKAADGPIFEDSIYNGESYDARRETPGWDRHGFDAKDWPAAEAIKGPAGVLSAQLMPAIQVVDTIVPLKMTSPLPGVYIFDMGQNFSGWARLRVEGPRGTDVRLRFAELLYENGTVNQETLRAAQAEVLGHGHRDLRWSRRVERRDPVLEPGHHHLRHDLLPRRVRHDVHVLLLRRRVHRRPSAPGEIRPGPRARCPARRATGSRRRPGTGTLPATRSTTAMAATPT